MLDHTKLRAVELADDVVIVRTKKLNNQKNYKAVRVSAFLLSIFAATSAFAEKKVFTPSVEVKKEYTDNLFFSSQNVVEDFITTVSPGVVASRETERYKASLQVRLDALAYADNSELNAIDQSCELGYAYSVSPQLDLDVEAAYTKDSRSDRDVDQSGLVLGTNTRENKRFSGNTGYMLNEKTSVSLNYQYFRSDIDDDAYSDMYSHNLSTGLTHDLGKYWPNAFAMTNMGYSRLEYTNARLDNYSATVGFKKQFTELYSLRLNVGPRYTRSDFHTIGMKSSEWGVKTDTALSHDGEKTKASLSFSKDLNSGTSEQTGTTDKSSVSAAVTHRFADEWVAVFNASYHQNKSDSGSLSLAGTDERSINISPGLRYKFTENVHLAASYKYSSIKNDTNNTRAKRNLLFATIDWQWPLQD